MQELDHNISGKLALVIGGQTYTLNPGDTPRIKDEPFECINPYDSPATAIWVIARPVY